MSNVFREVLISQGISSGSQLADRMKAPAVIFFFAGTVNSPYAELRYWDTEGRMTVSKKRSLNPAGGTLSSVRRQTVEAAQKEAAVRLSLSQWSRAPFSNCWLPTSVLEEARKEFMELPETA